MRKTLASLLTGAALVSFPIPAYSQNGYNPDSNPDYTKTCMEVLANIKKSKPDMRNFKGYNHPISSEKAKEIFPGDSGYIFERTVENEFNTYAFYRKPKSAGWDMAVTQGAGGIIFVYYKNGPVENVPNRETSVVNGHDLAFWIKYGSGMRLVSGFLFGELKNMIHWSYFTCGEAERINHDRIYNSGKKAPVKKAK
ncbi:hypothetical protein J4234_06820 [Candidatus Woesearchaeota archaeon]|nr:hypothetical protein [Candidatus Woesearchaeota archaeon]